MSGYGDLCCVGGESLGFSVSGFGRLVDVGCAATVQSVMHHLSAGLERGLNGEMELLVPQKDSQFRTGRVAQSRWIPKLSHSCICSTSVEFEDSTVSGKLDGKR